MAKRISVVFVSVSDMDRAIEFYQKTLNLHIKFKSAEYSEFDLPGTVLALWKNGGHGSYDIPLFTIAVDNVEEETALLDSEGVSLHKPIHEEEYGRVIVPYDSEGNIFEVVQYKDKETPRRE
jgi:predicted enzyme related to lactoylglutathione lyase